MEATKIDDAWQDVLYDLTSEMDWARLHERPSAQRLEEWVLRLRVLGDAIEETTP